MDLALTPEEEAFGDEARRWLQANVVVPAGFGSLEEEFEWGRRWQARLAADRWVGIHWPEEYGGRGATPVQVAIFNMEYARSKAPQPVNRNGINHVGPTILAHGTDEQKARWLPRILSAEEIWCQLFSEPGAGSDLASLTTRAVATEGGWVLEGQKVWTSYAQFARWGIALVRTDPEASKHTGLSYLVVDMTSPGVDIRPLVTITGESEFNEVFLNEVFVPSDCLIGALEPRVVGGQHDPGPRAGHDLPLQGAGRARGLPGRALRARRRAGAGSTTRRWPTPWPRRPSSCGCCGCTTGAPSHGWRTARSRGPSRAWSSCTGPT